MKKISACSHFLLVLALLFAANISLRAGLVEQWEFHRSDVFGTDGTTITGVNGRIATIRGNGAEGPFFFFGIRLPGGSSASAPYIDLPNNLLGEFTNLTVEVWLRLDSLESWQRVFDFGSTTSGELTGPGGSGNGSSYIMLAPNRDISAGQNRIEFKRTTQPVTNSVDTSVNVTLRVPHQFTYVWQQIGSNAVQRWYLDGVLAGESRPFAARLNQIYNVNNWLGRSNFTGDSNTAGIYYRCSLFNHAMTAAEIKSRYSTSRKPPVIKVTSPTPNQRITNAILGTLDKITGVITDSDGIAEVRVISSAAEAYVGSGPKVYNLDVPVYFPERLAPGSNTVTVIARDALGFSTTNNTIFFSVVPQYLNLVISGGGTVKGVTNGQVLNIGQSYSVKGIASNGWFLESWAGLSQLFSQDASFNFLMPADGKLRAKFVPNPLTNIQGSYHGVILSDEYPLVPNRSGNFSITISPNGRYSAKAKLGTNVISFTGSIYVEADVPSLYAFGQKLVTRPGQKQLAFYFEIPFGPGLKLLAGEVIEKSFANVFQWHSALTASRDVGSAVTNIVVPGRYNFYGPASLGNFQANPGGHSFGTMTVNSAGAANGVLYLADGVTPPTSFSTSVGENSRLPFALPLNGTNGVVYAALIFVPINAPATVPDLQGDFFWFKRPSPSKFYPGGFGIVGPLTGNRYVMPAGGFDVLGWIKGIVDFYENIPPASPTHTFDEITFDPNKNTFSLKHGNPRHITIGFNPTNGLFTGSFVPATGQQALTFKALDIQDLIEPGIGQGFGYFRGSNHTGNVQIYPSTITRWASKVLNYSSAYGGTNIVDFWSTAQVLGTPNTFPSYGDIGSAWASTSGDDQIEFLELGFDAPVPINAVNIYETFSPGAVNKVSVRNPSTGKWVQVWSGTAAPAGNVSRIFTVSFPMTKFPVSAVRIDIDSPAVPDFNEIDAVSVITGPLAE